MLKIKLKSCTEKQTPLESSLMKERKVIDISVPIREDMVIYPGDVEFSRSPICTIDRSGCNMTKLILGTHTGTHIDAPLHFLKDGESIDEIPLDVFIGMAQVIEIERDEIGAEEIEKKIISGTRRIIFKTKNSHLWEVNKFSKKYVHLTEDGARFLIEKRIKLVGIDYISIERFGTPTFSVHKMLFSNKIPILEGLNLKDVKPGIYLLIALPLKLERLDGSPVRAVLVEEQS